MNEEREHGEQPLDGITAARGPGNHDLIVASTEPLTDVLGEGLLPSGQGNA